MRRIRHVLWLMASLVLLTFGNNSSADNKQARSLGDGIAWGKPDNGLQLGILAEVGDDGHRTALFDGQTLTVSIQVRNAGDTVVGLLPSTFGCAALGHCAGIPVTKLILTPNQGGEPIVITYQGNNHVSEDRPLDADDVRYYTTRLAPGKILDYPYSLKFTPGEERTTSWQRTGESNQVPDGKYHLKAVLVVNRRESAWKGELTSGSMEVELRRSDKR